MSKLRGLLLLGALSVLGGCTYYEPAPLAYYTAPCPPATAGLPPDAAPPPPPPPGNAPPPPPDATASGPALCSYAAPSYAGYGRPAYAYYDPYPVFYPSFGFFVGGGGGRFQHSHRRFR